MKFSHWFMLGFIRCLLGNHGLEGEADFGDFAAITGAGGEEDLVAEAEVAVLYAPVDLGGQGVEHAELAFLKLAEYDDLARLF